MNKQLTEANCPNCGLPIPVEARAGICPACALRAVSIPTESGEPPADPTPAPSPEVVGVAFPQLEILELIGQGGMGVVYKARQSKLDRLVALKLLQQPAGTTGNFAERFKREARVLARLNHPGIVSVYDYGEAGEFFYLLMEFVDGVNLRQAMKARRFTPAQALALVPKVCEALQYAHDEGVLHRDIKPENVLLDTRGRVKIADFGVAKLLGDKAADAALTASGLAVGTPHYMAPEQLERPQDLDHRADIYSLGVVFYELLTGELPIGRFAPPSQKTPLDPRVDEVVLRALEKERERRQHNAAQVKTEVEHITADPLSWPGAAGPSPAPATPVAGAKISVGSLGSPGDPTQAEATISPRSWERRWVAWPAGARQSTRAVLALTIFALAILFVSFEFSASAGGEGLRWSVGLVQPWLQRWEANRNTGTPGGMDLNLATISFTCGIAALLLGWLMARLARAERLADIGHSEGDRTIGRGSQGTVACNDRVAISGRPETAMLPGRRRISWMAVASAICSIPSWLLVIGLLTGLYDSLGPDGLPPRGWSVSLFELLVLGTGGFVGLAALWLGREAVREIRGSVGRIVGGRLAATGLLGIPTGLLVKILPALLASIARSMGWNPSAEQGQLFTGAVLVGILLLVAWAARAVHRWAQGGAGAGFPATLA